MSREVNGRMVKNISDRNLSWQMQVISIFHLHPFLLFEIFIRTICQRHVVRKRITLRDLCTSQVEVSLWETAFKLFQNEIYWKFSSASSCGIKCKCNPPPNIYGNIFDSRCPILHWFHHKTNLQILGWRKWSIFIFSWAFCSSCWIPILLCIQCM